MTGGEIDTYTYNVYFAPNSTTRGATT